MSESVHLSIPWPLLVSDNRRHGLIRGKILLTVEYRNAKEKAGWLAAGAMKGRDPLKGPLSLSACLYEPNRSRKRDCSNFAKLVNDALEGIVYDSDAQLDDVRYCRGPIDPDNPRLEVTVATLAETHAPSTHSPDTETRSEVPPQ